MENYIKGNKEAWEEAFDLRSETWGENIVELVRKMDYAFFEPEFVDILKKYDMKDKSIGQFCCNNGRELLSLVKTTGAKKGIGFDIAENMVSFAGEKARELSLPCEFVAVNILDLGEKYLERFDYIIITIGATCWFKNLEDYFAIVTKSLKKGGVILIHEQHPFINMIATEGDDAYDENAPLSVAYSYFEHKWISSSGMNYITGRDYKSKTFTDYTHSVSEFIHSLCVHGVYVTDMVERDNDISNGFQCLEGKGLPLSMIISGKKFN